MRVLIALLCGLLLAASASAQGLPQAVADAYRAYESALDAENWAEAARQAETAWRAAEEGGVAPETTTVLAANFGEVALLIGNNAGSAEAYERAVELMGRRHEDVATRSTYLRYAAQARFLLQDYRATKRLSREAVQGFERLPEGEARSVGLYHGNMLRAFAHMNDREAIRGGDFAQEAMEALGDIGPVQNDDTASLTFLAGLSSAVRRQEEDAAYYLTISSYINNAIGSGPDASAIATAWASYIRGELQPGERAELLRRLRDSGYAPAECSTNGEGCYPFDWASQFGEAVDVLDAEPVERRPPRYPDDAAMAGISGFALLRFDVTSEGEIIDPEAVYSIPVTSFGEASLRALRDWEYRPAMVDGVPVDREDIVVRMEFYMEN
ncbi:energy transducer TonB [Hyphobacterium sp.]|uniref:energy transducer TonB n=1 Tax=Hyphobacterium sp. TaxID=2004662 RepID=UPI003BAC0414